MRTKSPGRTKQPRPTLPQYISKTEMADILRCTPQAITDWVSDGIFPSAALEPGKGRVSLWLLDDFLEFTRTGRWPGCSTGGHG
jgi:hypothetical protein